MLLRLGGRIYSELASAFWYSRYRFYRSQFDIDPSFDFNGRDIDLRGDSTIRLGARSYMGARCSVAAYGAPVSVGEDCRISYQVGIWTSVTGPSGHKVGAVTIGDRVLIGYNAFIGPGVTIGDDAAVGACCVVTRDVPAGSVVRSAVEYATP